VITRGWAIIIPFSNRPPHQRDYYYGKTKKINKEVREKNEKENFTLRYYGIGAQIIKDLRVKNMILVTRTRKKIIGLEGFGLKIKKQEIIK